MIEHDRGGITIPGGMVTKFVQCCTSLAEARRSLPDLTAEEYRAIRAGELRFVGDSKNGLSLEPVA